MDVFENRNYKSTQFIFEQCVRLTPSLELLTEEYKLYTLHSQKC